MAGHAETWVHSSHGVSRVAQIRVSNSQATAGGTWVERIGRTGYAVKGITYLLIAYLALRAGMGDGEAQSTRGALREIEGPAVGDIALLLIAAGLGAYALWKLYVAIVNPEYRMPLSRLGAGFVAAVNGGLAFEAVRLALSSRSGTSGSNEAVHWSALVLAQPLGAPVLAMVGSAIMIYGVVRIAKGAGAKLDRQLRLRELRPGTRTLVVNAARIGIAARGFVFVLVGAFLTQAALNANPADAKDFGYTLRELQKHPFGPWLLGAAAVGLFLYGVYELVRARYRRFKTIADTARLFNWP